MQHGPPQCMPSQPHPLHAAAYAPPQALASAPMPRQNTSPQAFPLPVLQHIEQLAAHISAVRKQRGETQAQWAHKLGISQPTMARLERGDPSIATATYVMCSWLLNPQLNLLQLLPDAPAAAAVPQLPPHLSRSCPLRRAAPRRSMNLRSCWRSGPALDACPAPPAPLFGAKIAGHRLWANHRPAPLFPESAPLLRKTTP